MNFALNDNPRQSELAEAVNYLLANLNSSTAQYDASTGLITQNNIVIGYIYKYLWLKYSTSFNGSMGFGDTPTNATYYGLRNTDSNTESSDPTDYIWYPASFGASNLFWYLITGGRRITTFVGTTSPGTGWVSDAGPPIDLDAVVSSSTNGLLAFNGGQTANTTINSTVTYTTGGVTLLNQSAAASGVWRVSASGSFVAVNSATARNAQVAAYWGATQLTAITVPVLTVAAQTTNWQLEFILTGSSTSAIWTAGYLSNQIGSATSFTQTQATAASTVVTAGPLTLDLRFSMSVVVATDQWVVNSVTLERLK